MNHITEDDHKDFLTKVVPLAEAVVEAEKFTVRKGYALTRAINLAMGLTARNKAERQVQEILLAAIARKYPGKEYPALCPPSVGSQSMH